MKRGLFAVAVLLAAPLAAQTVTIAPPQPSALRVQLDAMPLGELTTLLMRDVMRVPYVIAPDVLGDQRPVSVNLTLPRKDIPVHVVRFLRSIGLTVTLRGGTVYVTKGELDSNTVPSGSPLVPGQSAGPVPVGPVPSQAEATPVVPDALVVIRPAHRGVMELVDALEGTLPGLAIAARRDSARQGGEIVDRLEPQELVFSGPDALARRAVSLVKALDQPKPMIQVKAVVFEVRTTSARRSALSMLASIGGLSVGSTPGQLPGDQFVRIASGGLNAVLSATSGDSRFKIIAEPALAALSGSAATINSGSEVPTLGAVSFAENGAPVRSIVYRTSGVSLTVTPYARQGGIELDVQQERSSFARTNTGVDDSPTLNTSKTSSRIVLAAGETVAVAGLDQRSDASARSGLLGGLLGGRSKDSDQGQLLIVLQADLMPQERTGETLVQWIEEGKEGVGNLGSPRKAAEPPTPKPKAVSTSGEATKAAKPNDKAE